MKKILLSLLAPTLAASTQCKRYRQPGFKTGMRAKRISNMDGSPAGEQAAPLTIPLPLDRVF